MKKTDEEITWNHLKHKKESFVTSKAYMLGEKIVGLNNLRRDSRIKNEVSDEELEPNPCKKDPTMPN